MWIPDKWFLPSQHGSLSVQQEAKELLNCVNVQIKLWKVAEFWMLPLNQAKTVAVMLSAPWHGNGLTWEALDVIIVRNPEGDLLAALGAVLKQGANTNLRFRVPSLRHWSFFFLWGLVIYGEPGQHPAWGSKEGRRSQDLAFLLHSFRGVWESYDMASPSFMGR